jgi:hypothetical protein
MITCYIVRRDLCLSFKNQIHCMHYGTSENFSRGLATLVIYCMSKICHANIEFHSCMYALKDVCETCMETHLPVHSMETNSSKRCQSGGGAEPADSDGT